MFCPKCGNQLPDGAKFCTKCGNAAPVVTVVKTEAPAAKPAPEKKPAQASAAPAEKQAPKKKKKTGLIVGIIVAVVVILAVVAGVVFVLPMIQDQNKYDEAQSLIENGEIDDAMELLEELGDYKDCADLIKELEQKQEKYEEAMGLLEEGNVEDALKILEELKDFRDSAKILQDLGDKQTRYQEAMDLLDQSQHDEAYAILAELGEYQDSQQIVAQIEEMIEAYDEAMTLLEEECFADAIEVFEDLDDFRDSQEMAEKTVPLKYADYCFAEAERYDDADIYEFAAEIYLELDQNEKAMACYLAAGRIMLDSESWEDVAKYMDMMDEETQTIFREECSAYSVDDEALAAIEESIRVFYSFNDENDAEYVAFLWNLLSDMEQFENAFFMDSALGELVQKYIQGLRLEYDTLDSNGATINQGVTYEAYAMQYEVADALAESYGLFSDDPEMYEAWIGHGGFYRDMSFVLQDMYAQINEQEPLYDHTYGQYILYTNNSERVVEINYYFEFLDDGYPVATSEWMVAVVQPGQTVELWLAEPNNCPYWNRWLFYRSVSFVE